MRMPEKRIMIAINVADDKPHSVAARVDKLWVQTDVWQNRNMLQNCDAATVTAVDAKA
jgi:hypothetical protein